MPETSDRQRLRPGKLPVDHLLWDSQHFKHKMGCVAWPPGLTAQTMSEEEAGLRIRAVVERARDEKYQFLMARTDPKETGRIHALETNGFRIMDALVTWQLWPFDPTPPIVQLPADTTITIASQDDVPSLMEIARRAFADRTVWLDRFHADPRIPPERANELYAQWVKNSVPPVAPESAMADITWIAKVRGAPAGFLTADLIPEKPDEKPEERGETIGRVPLNAVDQPYRQRGLYRALAATAVAWFQQQGCGRVWVRTSVASVGVHRTWGRLGANLVNPEYTFHWWA